MSTVYVIITELPEAVVLYSQERDRVNYYVLNALYKYCGKVINNSNLNDEEKEELAELIKTVERTFTYNGFFNDEYPLEFEAGDLMFHIGMVS